MAGGGVSRVGYGAKGIQRARGAGWEGGEVVRAPHKACIHLPNMVSGSFCSAGFK